MFSPTVMEHFAAPRNTGAMPDADAEAQSENPVCGDRLHVWLRFGDGRVQEMRWQAEGCAPTIAAASVTSELVRGLTVGEVLAIDRARLDEALGGVPARKAHAILLVLSALRRALTT